MVIVTLSLSLTTVKFSSSKSTLNSLPPSPGVTIGTLYEALAKSIGLPSVFEFSQTGDVCPPQTLKNPYLPVKPLVLLFVTVAVNVVVS